MLTLLAAVGLAQDLPPLVDTLPLPEALTAAGDCDGAHVPGMEWDTALIDSAAADALTRYAFPSDLDRADKQRAGIRTDAVLVVHNGRIVYEQYAPGWTADQRHLAWSASKTFTGVLTGIAADAGLLQPTDSICQHLDLPTDAACTVTIEDLLSMASGFDWRETYEGTSPTASSVLAMLYGEGRHDTARFVAGHPLAHTPGSRWMYSSGDTNVLSAIVGAALRPVHGDRFPYTALFEPLHLHPT